MNRPEQDAAQGPRVGTEYVDEGRGHEASVPEACVPDPRESRRRAVAVLLRLVEPPSPHLVALVDRSGPEAVVERLLDDRPPELALFDDGSRPLAEAKAEHARAVARLDRWRARLPVVDVDRDLMLARRVGARLVVPGDDEWPTGLDALGTTRPLGLWVRGRGSLRELAERSVAVVGARACTAYGEHVASSLSAELVSRGWSVVSGAAFGIDAAAHRGALAAGGPTLAVLACGVDLAYPRAHDTLLARVAEDGLVVSEYPPATPVTRGRFLDRNRLLAALTRGTVLVEAGLRSGSRSTVKHARSLNRPVLVVPGPVTSPASAGCHAELRAGGDTFVVTDADDVLEVLGPLAAEVGGARRGPDRPLDQLGADALRVYDAMPQRAAIGVDDLCLGTGLPVGELLALLGQMAADGFVRAEEGGWARVPAGRGGTRPGA
ncbi:DNA processing protein [Motilibacter peucedani]|uniref:DNA processing protein n=1 Tax=Motilibacter peucedani TaxID=598650 RepID=A0A420XR25_9ACTN|nr:DNA-processing protein DprA [Motilibacter peucedani]RKS77356.1 DNA processing protein [Motilibacter peucedani]